ncbi:YhcN/YlaJ family sporulation lipoprotein [Paenibacillus mendelii]|nr:YhcN/YlaJ family sporulation lipoprotein [Paenibacillus mendelii]
MNNKDGVRTNQYRNRSVQDGVMRDGFKTRSTTDGTLMDGNRTRPTPNGTTGPLMDGIDGNRTGTNMNGMDGMNGMNGTHTTSNKDASDKIAKHISSVKGVSKATVVVHNNDAIVGLDVKAGENTSMVEKEVKRAVERVHPGYTVYVTTDKNLHSRIRGVQSQMVPLDGHPIRNMTEDVGTLIRDMGRTITAPFR